jgi:hypothetical protein
MTSIQEKVNATNVASIKDIFHYYFLWCMVKNLKILMNSSLRGEKKK